MKNLILIEYAKTQEYKLRFNLFCILEYKHFDNKLLATLIKTQLQQIHITGDEYVFISLF
jgi:hypothetical protein